jgi:hypothetical protein
MIGASVTVRGPAAGMVNYGLLVRIRLHLYTIHPTCQPDRPCN